LYGSSLWSWLLLAAAVAMVLISRRFM
jgi:hypothetical protein